jgi:DNA-binding CsgD family transcriptional regulator
VLSDSVLSDAEGRVAELAVRGYTNREIGLELWITVSTVEQHLTRVYRKLGVSGRGGLAPGLRRRDVADQAAPA